MTKLSSIGAKSLFFMCALLLQACATSQPELRSNAVAQAFETSGVIVMPPYTRTVFSSSNF